MTKWGALRAATRPSGEVGNRGSGEVVCQTVIKTKQGISYLLEDLTPSKGGCEGVRVSACPSPLPHFPVRPAQAFRASLGAAA